MDGYCVDFSDSTLRCLKAYESMFPCLLHESSGSFSGEFGYNLNTRQLITFRQELFEEGSLYKIVQIGSTRQMLVGQLSADGKYGIIVSTGMAQITTAAEVLRSILWPVALILLVLDLLFAMLFSRWFTRPVQQLSAVQKRLQPVTTISSCPLYTMTRSASWPRISTTWPLRSSAAPSWKRTFWPMSATTCAPR